MSDSRTSASWSRRGFLRAVGVSGGAGTMFAAMGALGLAPTAEAAAATPAFSSPKPSDFTLTGHQAASVVILGGGIAGLISAYELGKAGYRCTVLEPRSRTGGRNFTARGGTTETDLFGQRQTAAFSQGQYMNCGPARLAQWMVTLDYCRELGVPIEVFTNTNADAFIYNEAAGMTKPERYRTAKADVYGYVSELLAKASSQGALDSELTSDDKERLIAFLKDWGQLDATGLRYTDAGNRGFSTYPAAAGTPGTPLGQVPALSEVFASGVGRYFSFEFGFDQAMLMFQPVGGMDKIPIALTAASGAGKIRLGCQATKITERPEGVTVEYSDAHGHTREITADYLIAAMPPHLLAKLPHNLGPAVQSGLQAITPSSASKIGLEYKSRWWETDYRIYGGITETDLDLGHVWHPSYGFHGDRGVLIGYYNYGSTADKYGKMTPAQREARAVMLGEKIYGPKYRTELASSFSQSWRYIPHIEGAWHSTPDDGPDAPVLKPLAYPTGRTYFAGDWLSYQDAWQQGAITSARSAVTQLHKRQLSVGTSSF